MTRARDLADIADKDITGTLTVDDIVLSGGVSKTGDLTFDVSGDIILDADDNGNIQLHDGGTYYGLLREDNNNFQLYSIVQDGDMVFRGNDGGSNVTALTLDMSEAGAATFNSSVDAGAGLRLSTDGSNNAIITALGQDKDIYFSGDDNGSGVNALILDMSAAGAATFNSSVTLADTLSISSASTSGFLQASSNILQFGTSSDDPVAFFANNAERMRIDGSSGNVGIGNSSMSSYYSDRFVIGVGDEDGMTIVGSPTHQNYIMFADGTSGDARYKGYIAYDHNVDTMKLATNGATRLQIDSAGRAGLGVTPAAVADSTGVASLQAGGSFLIHYDIDGSGTTSLNNNMYFDGNANKALFYGSTSQYYQTGGIHYFRRSGVTSAGSTATMSEIVRFDGDGIKFNGDSAGANALNFYETGSWTPVIGTGNGSTTASHTAHECRYVRVGNTVNITGYLHSIVWSQITDGTYINLTGLPFASAADYLAPVMLAHNNTNVAYGYVDNNGAVYLGNSSGSEYQQQSNAITGNRFMLTIVMLLDA